MTAVAAHWADTGEFPAEIETVYSPCICRWDRELAMIAFDGWKSLHYRLKQQQLDGEIELLEGREDYEADYDNDKIDR